MKIFFKLLLTANCFLLIAAARGQETDTLEGMRTFLKASNAYQELPLQMELQMQKSTNLVTGLQDTLHFEARFCLQKEGSYVSFGELEQVVDDSLMLLVNNRLKKMIVYSNHRSVTDQMKQYLGLQWSDSSLLKMAKKFTAFQSPAPNGMSIVELKSRFVLYHTQLSPEDIRISYNTTTFQPSEVVEVKRTLVPLNEEQYQRFALQPDFTGKLVQGENNSHYVVKEQVSTYRYRHISHDTGKRLPVMVADRIGRDPAGRYSPVKGYAGFAVNQQF